MSTPDAKRTRMIEAAQERPLDLLVIGGGIVGAGVARDAAMRGLRVALVEQHDFAFGTSSRSTRLLHGGIRYLQQFRLGLVHEASVEKRVIARIAPHLAEPMRFIYPVYERDRYSMWQMRIGVKVYDLLSGGRNLGRSDAAGTDVVQRWLPKINDEQLRGAVRYYDALTNDARLVLDSLRSAARHGATVLNYMPLLSAERSGDVWVCRCRDENDGREYDLRARCVVNATGPWASHWQHSGLQLRPSKGVHLVVDRSHLPVDDAVVVSEGKRILFVIPWGERLILGTTDTDYQGSLEDVRAEPADVSYILNSVNTAFKGLMLSEGDIISHWAGLRPLIADSKGTPSDISRRHVILNGQPGWWDIAGGKLTTYRLIAEQALDRIVKRERFKAGPCLTARQPLLAGGLTDTYSGILPPPLSEDSVIYYCTHEWARTLSDVMIRRTSWHHYVESKQEAARWVCHWMGSLLGWDDQERAAQYQAYQQFTSLSDVPPNRAGQVESLHHG